MLAWFHQSASFHNLTIRHLPKQEYVWEIHVCCDISSGICIFCLYRIIPYAEASLERVGEAPELPERLQPSQLTCHPAEVDTPPTGHTDRGVYLKSNQQESKGYFEVLPNQEESFYSTCGRAEEMVYEWTAVNYVTDTYYSANTGAEETVNVYDQPTINYVSDAYYTGVQLSPQ